MADLKITVDVTSLVDAKNKLTAFQGQLGKTGSGSVVGLARAIGSVERNIADLAEAQRKNQISSRAFSQGLLEQQKALEALGMSSSVAKKRVEELANSSNKMESFKRAMNGLSVNQLVTGVGAVQSKIKQLVDAQAKGTIGANAYQKGLLELKRAYEQLGYSSQQATAAVRQYAAQLQRDRAAQQAARAAEELARAQAQAAARTRELRLRFQEGYAAFDRARQQMRDLREALRQGVITTAQYEAAVRRLRGEQQRSAAAAQGSTRGINGMGMVMQQTGYQVGDFLVQVQSGTNFMVAFGQQATQLVGILPLLGAGFMGLSMTALVALSASLGIIIPLVTAAGAAFMRARGNGKTLSQAIQDLESSFGELNSSVGILRDEELDQTFGNMAGSIRSLTESMVQLNNAAALTNLVSTLETLEKSANAGFFRQMGEGFLNIGRAISPFAGGEGFLGMKGPEEVNEEKFEKLGFSMARDQYFAYLEEMQKLASAGDIEGVTALIDRFIADAIDNGAELSLLGIQTAQSFSKVAISSAQAAAEMNGSAQAARDLAEREEARTRAQAEIEEQAERTAQFIAEQEELLANQTILYLEIAKYGENSLKVEEERAYQARLAYENELRRKEVDEALILVMMDQYDAMVKAREEAESSAKKAEEFADKLGISLDYAQQLAAIGFGNIWEGADGAAQLASNLALAARMAANYEGRENAFGGVRVGGEPPIMTSEGIEVLPQTMAPRLNPFAGMELEDLLPPRKKSKGAEGPNAVERLQQEIAFRQRTLNLSKEEKALQTEIFRITNALGKDRNKYSSQHIEQIARLNLAMLEQERIVEDARKQQEQLADSIANSFGDAFMSIVDGTKSTKDAFKEMAAAIVRDLYQVYVMKRLIGSAEAGTGIAGAIGKALFRESGGSMMAGRPYIVGERGPELVIPGRSSTVTNADLTRKSMGGSDAVIVNNNINVTGGTDPAAIRQEVAKLMPAITNATKTAVIDARRRGGQMKAAFQ